MTLVWVCVGEEINREAKKARKNRGPLVAVLMIVEVNLMPLIMKKVTMRASGNMSSGDDDDFNPFRDESSEDDEDGKFFNILNINERVLICVFEWDIILKPFLFL